LQIIEPIRRVQFFMPHSVYHTSKARTVNYNTRSCLWLGCC